MSDGPDHLAIENIVLEIATERYKQHEKWGRQDHESIYSEANRQQYERNAERWKIVNDQRVRAGRLTWDGILLEEVFEALAEEDLELRRAELIQVAAVAAAEVEAIDRELGVDQDGEGVAWEHLGFSDLDSIVEFDLSDDPLLVGDDEQLQLDVNFDDPESPGLDIKTFDGRVIRTLRKDSQEEESA